MDKLIGECRAAVARPYDWHLDKILAKATKAISTLAAELSEAHAARERAEGERDAVSQSAVDTLMARCKREDRHGDISFGDFVEMGGDQCPLCLKAENETLRSALQSLIDYQPEPLSAIDMCQQFANFALATAREALAPAGPPAT
jgi:hypothetical protein